MNFPGQKPSIRITFEKFMAGEFDDDYSIYIVRADDRVLYVGISKTNIYNRWFGQLSPHITRFYDDDNKLQYIGNSRIGQVVVLNMPESLSWDVQLIDAIDDLSLRLFISEEEKRLIRELRPIFNTTYAPELNSDELKLYKQLTRDRYA